MSNSEEKKTVFTVFSSEVHQLVGIYIMTNISLKVSISSALFLLPVFDCFFCDISGQGESLDTAVKMANYTYPAPQKLGNINLFCSSQRNTEHRARVRNVSGYCFQKFGVVRGSFHIITACVGFFFPSFPSEIITLYSPTGCET